MSIPSWLEKLESKVLPPISTLNIPEASRISTVIKDIEGNDSVNQGSRGGPTAEPRVNLPGPKPAPEGSNNSNRPNSISTRKSSSRSTWVEWENEDTNSSIKKGGEWNGDAKQIVAYQEGDDIRNSTHHDVAPTPIRESSESRSSTQLTANTTTPKDNSFFAAENDLFDEGENGASLEEWVQVSCSPTRVDMVSRGITDSSEELRRELLKTRAELKSANASLTILDHNYKKLWATQEEELRKARAEVQQLFEHNRRLSKELATMKLTLVGPRVDLPSRIENLRFSERADRVEPSTAQVSQKVIDLNEEIFQVAATVGEMIVPRGGMCPVSSEEMASAFQKSRKLLGAQMTIVLAAEAQNRHKNVNSMLAQVVLQIAITRWCAALISMWKPWDEKVDEVLDNVYSGIRKLGNQSVSGTWRSLTRSQWHSPNQDCVTNFTDDLACIFHTAGWTTRNQDEEYQFEKRLPAILKSVQDVRVALGEDVISADIEIALIEPGTPFNSKSMKNNYDDGKSGGISGTTGMGLKRIVMESASGGFFPHTKTTSLPRPRVILEGTFREIVNH